MYMYMYDLPMMSPIPSSSFWTGILLVSMAVSPLDSVRPVDSPALPPPPLALEEAADDGFR